MLSYLNFKHNEAEYEALLAAIKMCKAVGALEIEAKSDSLLVVSQVNGDFECKEASMSKYMQLIQEEVKTFEVICARSGFKI